MSPDELIEKLNSGPVKPVAVDNQNGTVFVTASAEGMPRFAKFLAETAELQFDLCEYAYGTDWPAKNQMEVGYFITSTTKQHDVVLRCYVDRDNPRVNTLCNIWLAAELHEREVYDLLGVDFTGHPDLRRIITPAGFTGHPLRKDYSSPDFEPLPK